MQEGTSISVASNQKMPYDQLSEFRTAFEHHNRKRGTIIFFRRLHRSSTDNLSE
jgi:hypothetical protein